MLDSAMMNFAPMRTPSPLTCQEQAVLALKAKAGDETALSVLIRTNIKIAVKIALQHHRQTPKHSLSPYDLIHTAILAIPKAIAPFDPSKNVPFGSYAAFFMRRDILDYINESGTIYVPKRKDNAASVPSYCYLDAGTEDFYVPELGQDPDQLGIENEMDITAALAHLSPRQRRVVELRLGFVDDTEVSFCAMGREAGTSRGPHIAQYKKAITRLRTFFGVEEEQKHNERGCEVKHARRKTKTSTS